jgi:hypothetical protein
MTTTEEPWAGPAESKPGAVVRLPGGHHGVVQPHDHHPSRAWVHIKDLTTGVHRCEMIADLVLLTDQERLSGRKVKP